MGPIRSFGLAVSVLLLVLGSGPMLQPAMPVHAQTLSVQGIYAHLQATLRTSGKSYYVAVTETSSGAVVIAPHREQVWVDGAHDVARQLVVYSAGNSLDDTFYLKHITVVAFRYPSQGHRPEFAVGRPFPTCQRAGIMASLLIGCPLYLDDNPIGDRDQNLSGYTEKALAATYSGKPAVLLQVQGVISDLDGTFRSTAKLYLDPTTFLPIARVTTTSGFAAGVETTVASFAVSAVNPSTFPHNFFDPASIGYRGVDAVMRADLATLPSGFPVYWLGMHWKGTSALGPLALSNVDRAGAHRVGVGYAPPTHRFGLDGIEFFEGAAWGAPLLTGRCVSRQRTVLAGGYAVILSSRTGLGCTGSGTVEAVVTLGKLKITVIPTFTHEGQSEQAKYRGYSTVAGLTAVLKALVRR